jgi:O-acetyl-ADP-ribose deacetylase (regulator of RNase III)
MKKTKTLDFITLFDYYDADVYCHIVNCQGVMGRGIASEIKSRWPKLFQQYNELCMKNRDKNLGDCFLYADDKNCIANLFAQNRYGTEQRHLNYEALYTSVEKVKSYMLLNDLKEVAIPENVGCGLAGGNWRIVKTIFEEIFKDTEIQLTIVRKV